MIEFTNSKKGQIEKLVENKKVIVYLVNIPIVLTNNSYLSKNNIKYI